MPVRMAIIPQGIMAMPLIMATVLATGRMAITGIMATHPIIITDTSMVGAMEGPPGIQFRATTTADATGAVIIAALDLAGRIARGADLVSMEVPEAVGRDLAAAA